MNQEKINTINAYVNNRICPVLIEGVTSFDMKDAVILPANLGVEFLNGHYQGVEFLPPDWYNEILNKKNLKTNVLVIDNITSIPPDEQLKFCEILKHRKISTFELPENCSIIITCEKVNSENISREVYSLVAHL